ncbi:MAG TPA: hypothetical protein VE993_16385 [Stellaceae bacterium]|nr:hypothetical protein [Stellaceae bacterium]
MKRSVTPPERGGRRRPSPDEVGDGDPLYRAALAVERDEALAAETEEWEIATIGDGIFRKAPDRKSR